MPTKNFSQLQTVVLALFSGALLPLAFAPYDLPVIALLSLAFFLMTIRQLNPSRAAVAGYAYGWGVFGHGVNWVYFSIHHFGHAPLWLSIIIMLGMVAILALYMAMLAYLLNRYFYEQTAVRYLLAFPSLWVGLEALRGILFTGFPWLSLGFSHIDTWLSSWAPVVGVLGISWFVALTVGAAFCLFSTIMANKHKVLAVMLIITAWPGGLMLSHISWTKPAGEPIKVALLQGNISQNKKWLSSHLQNNLDIYMQMTMQKRKVDLVVWPETAVPAFFHSVKNTLISDLRREAENRQMDVVIGLPVMPSGASNYYNGLHSVRYPNDFYLKRHLVPLGEYKPLKPISTIILDFLNIPMSDFSSGADNQKLLQGAGYPFASSICYEDVFQQTSIDGLPEAAYLVNVSNDAWFGDTIAPYQHLQMARMRALESGRYLIRATNTGRTAIINSKGIIVKQAPMAKRVVLNGELTPLTGSTFFVQAGWWIVFVLISLLVLTSFLKSKSKV